MRHYWLDDSDAPFATLLRMVGTYCHPEAGPGAYDDLIALARDHADDEEMRRFRDELVRLLGGDRDGLHPDALFAAAAYGDGSDDALLQRLWVDLYGDEAAPMGLTAGDGSSNVEPASSPLRASVARMYDYYLGGKDNFEVDRAAADQVIAARPDTRRVAHANRGFLVRAVTFLAEQGVEQFIDLGAGIPTSPNVHEVARRTHPDARVVYVDNDPVVTVHSRALRARYPGVVAIHRDMRHPARILDDEHLLDVIDLDRPVGVLLVAVLHFVDHDTARHIVAAFRDALPVGSYLTLSTVSDEGLGRDDRRRIEAAYATANAPLVFRTHAQVAALFDGLALVEPGLVDVTRWRADDEPGSIRILCGVGRIR